MNAYSSLRTRLPTLTLKRALCVITLFSSLVPGLAYAGTTIWIEHPDKNNEISGVVDCLSQNITKQCIFNPGEKASARFALKDFCGVSQAAYARIISVDDDKQVGDNLVANEYAHTNQTYDRTFFLPTKPGIYRLNADIRKNFFCQGDSANRWFRIWKEPTVSPISAAISEIDGKEVDFGSENNVYHIPYARKDAFKLTATASDSNTNLNSIKSCSIHVDPEDIKKGKVVSNDTVVIFKQGDPAGVAYINPLAIKNNEVITIRSKCSMAGKEFTDQMDSNETATVIGRNNPYFGELYYKMVNEKDGPDAIAKIPDSLITLDWQSDAVFKFTMSRMNAITTPESCDDDGKVVDVRKNMLTYDAQNDTKNYAKYAFTDVSGGSCKIGYATDSPYAHYPYSAYISSVTLKRNPPRVVQSGNFSSISHTVTNAENTSVPRPGGKVKVESQATLSGAYPNAKLSFGPSGNALKLLSCSAGTASGNSCEVPITNTSSGTLMLQADSKLMERTSVPINLYGSNYELNEESGLLTLASRSIDITPVITLGAQLDAVNATTLAKKVFHYGREFTVDLQYKLLGKTPEGYPNTAFKGQLNSLAVQPKDGLQAGKVTAETASISVDNKTTGVSSNWQEISSKDFVASTPALEHGQVINLRVPVKVEKQTPGTANIAVLGSFTPSNVDMAPDAPALPTETVSIALGGKLLPAADVYSVTVNSGKPLLVSPNAKEVLLQVNFASKLQASDLMTGNIAGTEMNISLPKGMARSTQGENQLVLLCNGSDCSKQLNNAWDGATTASVLSNFTLDPSVQYQLKVPVTLQDNATLDANSQLNVSLTQSQRYIDQDTKERVVDWVDTGTPSTLAVTKAVTQETRGPVTLLPLTLGNALGAGSATLQDKDNYNLRVNIIGAQQGDTATLTAEGKTVPMTTTRAATKDGVAYVAENLPIPTNTQHPLSITFRPSAGAENTLALTGSESAYPSDPRNLECKLSKVNNISKTTCTLYWGGTGTPIPYQASDALLSIAALENAKTLSGLTSPELLKVIGRFNAKQDTWKNAVLFKKADWKTTFPAPGFIPTRTADKSLLSTGQGPLPIKGSYAIGN